MSTSLAIETSGRVGSVALIIDDQIQPEQTFEHGLQNAAKLLPIINRLCLDHGVGPSDINNVFVSIGPGSFTGLRIGVTISKTLAFATGARVYAIPTVQSLARNAPLDAREIVIVLDAKREQIFTARFRREGETLTEVEPAHLDSLVAIVSRANRPVYLIGEGITYHRQLLADLSGIVIADPPL